MGEAEPQDEMADVSADDTAVILYTSGTTGKPKGAELTHSNLKKNTDISREMFDLSDGAVTLGALPLFHSFGQTCGLNATISGGGMLTLIPRFDPEKALEIIQRDKVTVFEGVPTMYTAMLNLGNKDDYDVSSLEVCASGGAAMPGEVLRGFEEAFDCKVREGYGLSETSPVASFNPPDREAKIGSIGIPIEGVEMKVVDDDGNEVDQGEVGEIVIKGHNVMKGYWDREEATAESIKDGWFYTGDMAKIDEDGYFFIVDRKKELIIRGGYNVYPREIEEVLYEHPAVLEAAVLGVEDANMGEEVGAAVVLKERRGRLRGRHQGLRQGRGGQLQVPAQGVVRGRAPQGAHGQDPQARDRRAQRGRSRGFVTTVTPPPLLSGGGSTVFLIGGEHGGDHHRQHRHVGRSHLRLLHGLG